MFWFHFLIVLFFLIVLNLIGKNISRSILHPVRILVEMWSIFIIVALPAFRTVYEWKYSGIYWLLLMLLCTELGALIYKSYIHKQVTINELKYNTDTRIECKALSVDNPVAAYIGGVVLAFSIIGFFYSVSSYGIKLTQLFSFSGLIEVNTRIAHQRYSGKQSSITVLGQLFNVVIYASAPYGGYLFNLTKSKKIKILSIALIAPAVLESLVTNAKAGLIACTMLWLAGWLISYIFVNGKLICVHGKTLKRVLILVLSFILFLYILMILRTGEFTVSMMNIILRKLFLYAFGHMIQFDAWFAGEANFLPQTYGVETYTWIAKFFCGKSVAPGVYDIYYNCGDFSSNIFTEFRGLITDFGVSLTLLYMFIRGFLVQYAIEKLSFTTKISIFPAIVLATSVFFFLYGFIISPWIYTTYAFGMVGFCMMVYVEKRIRFRFRI